MNMGSDQRYNRNFYLIKCTAVSRRNVYIIHMQCQAKYCLHASQNLQK